MGPSIVSVGFSIGYGVSWTEDAFDIEYFIGYTWADFRGCSKSENNRRILSTSRNSEDEDMSIDFEDDLASDSDSDEYETSIGNHLLDRYGFEIGVSTLPDACPQVENQEYADLA